MCPTGTACHCDHEVPETKPAPACKYFPLRRESEISSHMHRLAQEMADLNYTHLDIFSVRFCVAEAIKNAIVHAHGGDASKIVHLSYLVAPDYVLAEVIDEGPGFDARSVPNPMALENKTRDLGKGLYFMKLFMTWIRHDGRGNRVTLCKIRTGAQVGPAMSQSERS